MFAFACVLFLVSAVIAEDNATVNLEARLGAGSDIGDISLYPYVVMMKYGNGNDIGIATMIKPHWVVTLAFTAISAMQYSGAYCLANALNPNNGMVHLIKSNVIPTTYVDYHSQIDEIGLVRVCPSFVSNVFPSLPTQGQDLSGTAGFMLGYQPDPASTSKYQTTTVLKYGGLTVATDAACSSSADSAAWLQPSTQLCNVYTSPGVNCNYQDNGTPFISDTGMLMGLAQVSGVCGGTKSDVFTDVAMFRNWIDTNSS